MEQTPQPPLSAQAFLIPAENGGKAPPGPGCIVITHNRPVPLETQKSINLRQTAGEPLLHVPVMLRELQKASLSKMHLE